MTGWHQHRKPASVRRVRRLGQAERLESRIALASDVLTWGPSAHLTLSFVQDGTLAGSQPSALFQRFNQIAPPAAWQEGIVRALQTWAQHTNADIGVVEDEGQSFGAEGATRGDARFGDIRIGAIPMQHDVFAISVPQDIVSGTWVGDLLFNTQATFSSLDDIFHVALHEAGNIFGLPDNQDPQSPLYSAGVIPSADTPTSTDIANLQAIYGTRPVDTSDADASNETLDKATRIRYSTNDGFDGSTPLIVHSDITTSDDADWYRLDNLSGYSGKITVAARTQGLSVAQLQVSLHDRDGVELASAASNATLGDRVSVTLQSKATDERYLVRISSIGTAPYRQGGYALVTTFDDLLQTDADTLAELTDGRLRHLDQSQIQRVLVPEPGHSSGLFADDLDTDNTDNTADLRLPLSTFGDGTKYQVSGSIADVDDVDTYVMTSPNLDQEWVGTVRLRGIDGVLSASRVELADASTGTPLSGQIVVNNGREFVIQYVGLRRNTHYLVRVIPANPVTASASPNYELNVGFNAEPVTPQEVAAGVLSAEQTQQTHDLQIPTWQLLHLTFEVGPAGSLSSPMELRLLDAAGGIAARIQADLGETRTNHAVLLPPGDYRLVVMTPSSPSVQASYRVLAFVLSDPLAVPPDDPLFDPLVDCPGHVLCFGPLADLNADGGVDAADIGIMFAMWGSNNASADMNADGIVDAADAGLAFSQWTGDTAPAHVDAHLAEAATFTRHLWW